jgi:hypothetical protein
MIGLAREKRSITLHHMAVFSREISGGFCPAWKDGIGIFSSFIVFILMQIV